MAKHERLGKVFAALKLSPSLRRPNHGDVGRLRVGPQLVADAFHQRVLRTNDHHIDGFRHTKLLDGLKVVGLHGYVFAAACRARVARGNIEFLCLVALRNFPGKRMLAPTTT